VTLSDGYAGTLGYASAAVMADYVVVDMFAERGVGGEEPEGRGERSPRSRR
jgi:multiple sugar transport system substrate-binding protein